MENAGSSYKKTVGIVLSAGILTALIVAYYVHVAGRGGTIVLPAGNTYLGPNAPTRTTPSPRTFTVESETPWHTIKGHIYPYTLLVPETLTLVTFPDDPYDMYGISWGDIAPISNVLIGVDDLSTNAKEQYVGKPKTDYIRAWWKQFSSLTGVTSLQPFTNAAGLAGYTVQFATRAGASSNLDIFFEVPARPQYVIHLSRGVLDPAVFAKIVDSVSWK